MPISHAVLALLAEGPSYGYELRNSFEDAIGPQWGELNIGHVYQILDRLIRDGLATSRTVPQSTRPDRRVFRLTKDGRAELEEWLDAPFVRQGGYRDDFFLKLFSASLLGSNRFRRVLKVQREAYLSELGMLADIRQRHRDQPLVRLLVEAAMAHTEANLRIVESAERDTKAIVSSAKKREQRVQHSRAAGRQADRLAT